MKVNKDMEIAYGECGEVEVEGMCFTLGVGERAAH
jgi:hypothetical protein